MNQSKNWIRNIALALSLVATGAMAQMNNPGAPGNVVAGNNMSQSGNILGIAAPVTVANGGTGTTSASGTALDNITGFSGTGFMNRTGSGAYSFVGSTGSGSVVLGTSPAIATPTVTGGSISGATGSFTTLGATTTNPSLTYTATGTGATARNYAAKFGDAPSSADYGTVGNGSTDDEPAMQNAFNALAGKAIHIPYTGSSYYLGSNVTQVSPPAAVYIDPGVTFSGPGKMPRGNFSTSGYLGTYLTTAPTGGAASTDWVSLGTELDAQSAFVGNGVAFFAGAYSPTGNPNFTGHLWSINTQTTLNASTGSYNAQGIEVDLNNHYQAQAGVGVLFSGLGEYSPQAAIEIARANTTSDWNNGIWLRNFVTGILIDGSTSAAPSSGLNISGLTQNHIVLTSSSGSASTNPVVTINGPGGSPVNYQSYVDGSVRIGNGSNRITNVSYSHFNSQNPGTIAANSTVDLTVTMGNTTVGTTNVTVNPYNSALPAGVTLTGWISATNTVTLRFANVTTSAITISSINVIVTAITTGT